MPTFYAKKLECLCNLCLRIYAEDFAHPHAAGAHGNS